MKVNSVTANTMAMVSTLGAKGMYTPACGLDTVDMVWEIKRTQMDHSIRVLGRTTSVMVPVNSGKVMATNTWVLTSWT